MKALLIVMIIITLAGALAPLMHAIEASRIEGSFSSPADSPDPLIQMEWAISRQRRQIEQLRSENAALTAKLAQAGAAITKPVVIQP